MSESKTQLKDLNKYKLLTRFLVIAEQGEFSEAELKDAVDLLHRKLFPERYEQEG